MNNSAKPRKSAELERERQAEFLLAEIFEQAGWRVRREPHRQRTRLDMIVRRPGVVYAAEVKAGVEGRL
jgi:Holliday junction resolvase